MSAMPILRDRWILARLADGHTLGSIAAAHDMHRDSISMRLTRAAGRAMVPSTYALLALAVEQGWIVRGEGGWIAPDLDHDVSTGGEPS